MRCTALLFACAATAVEADHRFADRDLQAGAALYAENCASCHGADLEGQSDWRSPGTDGILPAPPHDVTGHTWHHDTDLLVDYTLKGGAAALAARGVTDFRSGMPAFETVLSEDEVLDILAFIRAAWPDEAREIQRQRSHGGN
ncbi:Cytochrome C oxidase, cbb3-type, subunit III [Roseivivax lentus]|uniref:Cytochrome C oxidase, cbb3-type, subunit III n=1 Tax=Roseivivax lentus TaxID=633194 RepID=A0A1N7JKD7_9RHOB|nr:cytochrome c [Roseivivax lentus]SIS49788.1 Cytochrome C oxidase, cbb3-type, subunit III [Roseivivax lentus]